MGEFGMPDNPTSYRIRIAHCCCGSLRAETSGEPELVALCSCEECQRRTGSPFAVSTYWVDENVKLSGPTSVYLRDAQEGRKVTLHFCPTCGSSVYWRTEWPG